MLGRGQRAMGAYVGYYFMVKDPLLAKQMREKLHKRKPRDFLDGARILLTLKHLRERC
jgi:hypothetical protein